MFTGNEVACILADIFCDPCACNFNGNDEWLPNYCEFANTCCPHPAGVACWEQYLKYRNKKPERSDKLMNDIQTLRDCPFCGGHAYITFGIDKDTFVVQIQCERCGIRKTHCSHIDSPSLTNPACDFKRTEREAIDYWNGRMKVDAH